ncbi:MAG: efflux RND transporter periplasmic adaptor subunit [Ignavibacteriae bacterium]|nr:efflux RND transporter periplasmic adaptor subunit [Ignavibacteriota bacterium]NOG98359.1 efflux RND transporter periplasmic adaptor subunit [Ignavibacteriota bacterium]
MKRNRIKILLVMTVISLTVIACNSEVKESKEEFVSVKTAQVKYENISIPINTSGKIMASSETRLSFLTGGIIKNITVREGQKVKKGVLLASLDLSEIEAQVSNAKNGYIKAKRDFERVKNLYSDNVATLEQYQNSETGYEVAEANLKIAEFNYQHSKITAPADGKIFKKIAEEGELVSPGLPVFLFGTTSSSWRILVGLIDKDILKIKIGDSAVVELDAYPNQKLNAFVSEIGQSANPMNGTYEVELNLKSGVNNFVSGFVARVQIYPSRKQGIYLIPSSALVEADGDKGFVYRANKSKDTVEKIPITIIKILDDKLAVQSDFRLTEVINDGAVYLKADSKINIVE